MSARYKLHLVAQFVGSRLCGEKELDCFFHPPTSSHACPTFGQVWEPPCLSAGSRRRIIRSNRLPGRSSS